MAAPVAPYINTEAVAGPEPEVWRHQQAPESWDEDDSEDEGSADESDLGVPRVRMKPTADQTNRAT